MVTAYGPPEVLRVGDMPAPAPGPNEVLVRVRAASVSQAEMALRRGMPVARLVTGLRRPKHPVPGSELAGEVEAVGAAVTRFKPGDRVVAATGDTFGAHAEYCCLPEDGALAAQPAGFSHEEAVAMAEGGLTALPFLRDTARVQPGEHVVVNGASGAVGTAAVQIAKALGAHVTGVCGPAHVGLVASLGADEVVDYTETDFARVVEAYDVVFDAVGKSSFGRVRRALRPGGRYVTTTISAGIFPAMLASRLGSRRAAIAFTGLRRPAERARDLATLGELMATGRMRAVIDRRFALEDVAEAHRYVEAGHKQGSVVLLP